MKNRLRKLIIISAIALSAVAANAQNAPKIFIVDLAKLFDSHWKTQEQQAKIQADSAKAQEQLSQLQKDGNTLVEEFKALDEQSKNPAATNEAKADAQKKYDEIQRKRSEMDSFVRTTQSTLGQRTQTFKTLMIEEISRVAVSIAKGKGATLLIDKSGPTMVGVSNVLYYDPSLEITDEVMNELNKERPPAAAAPSNSITNSTQNPADSPKITVPGISPSK